VRRGIFRCVFIAFVVAATGLVYAVPAQARWRTSDIAPHALNLQSAAGVERVCQDGVTFQFADVVSPGTNHPHPTPTPLPAPRSYGFVAATPPSNGAPPPPGTIIAERTLSVPYKQIDVPGIDNDIDHRNFSATFTVRWSTLPVGTEVEFQFDPGSGGPLIYTVQNCRLPTQTTACRQVITANRTLQADILNCRADALVIGADDITINLNGHKIDGTGLGTAIDLAGHEGVTIQNGTIQQFDKGVDLSGSNDNNLRSLRLYSQETAGIFVSSSDATRIVGNTASNNFMGIALYDSNASEIVDNRAARNLKTGIRLITSHGNHLEQNRASANGFAGFVGVGSGLALERSLGNRVVNNALFDNLFGIFADEARNNQIIDNTASGNNRAGLGLIRSDSNRVELNTFLANSGAGILLACDPVAAVPCASQFFEVDGSDNNLIVDNVSFDNTQGILLRGADDNTLTSNGTPDNTVGMLIQQESFRNQVEANSAFGNLQDGIRVAADSDGTRLARNVAGQNSEDGIDVDNASPSTTIVGNTANDNVDLGIEADPGTTDGGGNRARGNGNAAQCTGVVCS
jgi:parallel beta-helix repeat protein